MSSRCKGKNQVIGNQVAIGILHGTSVRLTLHDADGHLGNPPPSRHRHRDLAPIRSYTLLGVSGTSGKDLLHHQCRRHLDLSRAFHRHGCEAFHAPDVGTWNQEHQHLVLMLTGHFKQKAQEQNDG